MSKHDDYEKVGISAVTQDEGPMIFIAGEDTWLWSLGLPKKMRRADLAEDLHAFANHLMEDIEERK